MTDRTNQMDKDDRMKLWLLLLLLLLIVVAVIVTVLWWPNTKDDDRQNGGRQSGSETRPAGGGERFEYSDFYHATDGTWIISDSGILVLKERKIVRDGKTIAEGWIDANFVRNAKRVESTE